MKIKLLVEGGNMQPGPAVGQQLGPLGVNIGQVISKVNEATKEFRGMKVPVELDINTSTKDFEVKVSSPPVSELLKKESGLEKGSGTPNTIRVGNLAIEQIIKVAKIKSPNMIVSDFKAAVKSVIGSCTSIGLFIENKEPKEIEEEIDHGNYDKEIEAQETDVSPEKKQKLDKFFKVVQDRQEKLAAEAARLAEEEAKAKEEAAAAEGEEVEGEKPEGEAAEGEAEEEGKEDETKEEQPAEEKK